MVRLTGDNRYRSTKGRIQLVETLHDPVVETQIGVFVLLVRKMAVAGHRADYDKALQYANLAESSDFQVIDKSDFFDSNRQNSHQKDDYPDKRTGRLADWTRAILTRRHSNVVMCALANKLARTAWVVVARHTTFDPGFAIALA
ncbi:hypothetical protein OKW26_004418 [Paraburkholderia sp. 32]